MKVALPKGYRAVIDRFGALDSRLSGVKTLIQEREALRCTILGWTDPLPPTEPVNLMGDRYSLGIAARRNERAIKSMQRAMRAMGEKAFLARCTLAIAALEETLTAAQVAKLIETAPTGPRYVSVTPRLAVEVKRAA
jgi:hypothetical protein